MTRGPPSLARRLYNARSLIFLDGIRDYMRYQNQSVCGFPRKRFHRLHRRFSVLRTTGDPDFRLHRRQLNLKFMFMVEITENCLKESINFQNIASGLP